MLKKAVPYLLTLLGIGVIAGLLTGLASPAAGMGLDWSNLPASGTSAASALPLTVAANVQAFYQGDPSIGWDSSAQYNLWWPSACSPAALTMVLRAWGASVRIGQVLDHLIQHQAITPEQGLLHADALEQVAKDYGYQAITFWKWSEQLVAQVTAQGAPVLLDVVDANRQTPYPGFVVGHWLVVTSVASDRIEVRDSSGYQIRFLSPEVFHTLFTGIGVVVWQSDISLSLPT